MSTGVLALCLRASCSPPPLVTCLAEKHSPEGQHDRGAARVEALRGRPSASAWRAGNRIWAGLGFPFGASSGRVGSLFTDPETLVKQRRRMGNSQSNGPKYRLVRPNRKPTTPPAVAPTVPPAVAPAIAAAVPPAIAAAVPPAIAAAVPPAIAAAVAPAIAAAVAPPLPPPDPPPPDPPRADPPPPPLDPPPEPPLDPPPEPPLPEPPPPDPALVLPGAQRNVALRRAATPQSSPGGPLSRQIGKLQVRLRQHLRTKRGQRGKLGATPSAVGISTRAKARSCSPKPTPRRPTRVVEVTLNR